MQVFLLFAMANFYEDLDLIRQVTIHDIRFEENYCVINLKVSKTLSRSFLIQEANYMELVKLLMISRPNHILSNYLFLNNSNKVFTNSPITLEIVKSMPVEIARYLQIASIRSCTWQTFKTYENIARDLARHGLIKSQNAADKYVTQTPRN